MQAPTATAVLSYLPEQLQRVVADAIMSAHPERATDIFYEDSSNVFVMRQGQQYQLRPPESYIWLELGTGTTSEIIDRVAARMNTERSPALENIVLTFLMSGEQSGLLNLFPGERTQRRSSATPTGQERKG